MKRGPLRRWRERGGRVVRVLLPFEDIMDVALALLALTPDELAALWRAERRFEPTGSADWRASRVAEWHRAVDRARSWAAP